MTTDRGLTPLTGLIIMALAVFLVFASIAGFIFFISNPVESAPYSVQVEFNQYETQSNVEGNRLAFNVKDMGTADSITIKTEDGYSATFTDSDSVIIGNGVRDTRVDEEGDETGIEPGTEFIVTASKDGVTKTVKIYTYKG